MVVSLSRYLYDTIFEVTKVAYIRMTIQFLQYWTEYRALKCKCRPILGDHGHWGVKYILAFLIYLLFFVPFKVFYQEAVNPLVLLSRWSKLFIQKDCKLTLYKLRQMKLYATFLYDLTLNALVTYVSDQIRPPERSSWSGFMPCSKTHSMQKNHKKFSNYKRRSFQYISQKTISFDIYVTFRN